MCASINANAYDFESDGIYYDILKDSVSVRVTFQTSLLSNAEAYVGKVAIPASVVYEGKEYAVKEIGHTAFRFCTELSEVQLPEGITTIDYDAFIKCTALTSVNIPSTITEIDHSIFEGCTALEYITIPATYYRDNWFGGIYQEWSHCHQPT